MTDRLTEPINWDEEWAEFYVWYCDHGYYKGFECPNCDCPTYLPEVLNG